MQQEAEEEAGSKCYIDERVEKPKEKVALAISGLKFGFDLRIAHPHSMQRNVGNKGDDIGLPFDELLRANRFHCLRGIFKY